VGYFANHIALVLPIVQYCKSYCKL